LNPHEFEIAALRRKRPPVAYAEIAWILKEKYDLDIQAPAIFKFVKVRIRGRKVYGCGNPAPEKKPALLQPVSKLAPLRPDAKPIPARLARKPIELPKELADNLNYEFKYNDHYNLERLSPEDAAAIRKILEAEGH
jgi:hypothetical protein